MSDMVGGCGRDLPALWRRERPPFALAILARAGPPQADGPGAVPMPRLRLARLEARGSAFDGRRAASDPRRFDGGRIGATGCRPARRRTDVTDEERQKAEALISRLEVAVGEIFPRDGAHAGLIASMIQSLNGLRSVLGIVRPH